MFIFIFDFPKNTLEKTQHFQNIFLHDGQIFFNLIIFELDYALLSIHVKSGELPLLYMARKISSQSTQVSQV